MAVAEVSPHQATIDVMSDLTALTRRLNQGFVAGEDVTDSFDFRCLNPMIVGKSAYIEAEQTKGSKDGEAIIQGTIYAALTELDPIFKGMDAKKRRDHDDKKVNRFSRLLELANDGSEMAGNVLLALALRKDPLAIGFILTLQNFKYGTRNRMEKRFFGEAANKIQDYIPLLHDMAQRART